MPSAGRYVLKDSHPAIQEALLEEYQEKEEGGDDDDDTISTTGSVRVDTVTDTIRNNYTFVSNLLKLTRRLPESRLETLIGTNNNEQEGVVTSNTSTTISSIRTVAAKGYRGAVSYLVNYTTTACGSSGSNTSATAAAASATSSNSNDTLQVSRAPAVELKIQGRAYNTNLSTKLGGIRLEDITLGTKFAILSATDDEPDTLQKLAKDGPWHLMAMKLLITDSGRYTGTSADELNNEVNKPLTELLRTYFDLTLDTHINISGWRGGHIIDTQGYIAHNDTTIVLSYRCTDTNKDWIANLNSTMSAWQTKDFDRGHSGVLSGLDIRRSDVIITEPNLKISVTPNSSSEETATSKDNLKHKGRVHTGFYNFFISSIPMIQQYIDPLLADISTPKTFYIVGHSLGAGITYMALAYFLLEFRERYDWTTSPHRLVAVTVGSPRAYSSRMRDNIDSEVTKLKGKVTAIRLVRDKDIITTFPPASLGFEHCRNKFVLITKDDAILINPNLHHVISKSKMMSLMEKHPSIETLYDTGHTNDNGTDTDQQQVTKDNNDKQGGDEDDEEEVEYKRYVRKLPRHIRDHMPDSYLTTLVKLLHIERQNKCLRCIVNQPREDI